MSRLEEYEGSMKTMNRRKSEVMLVAMVPLPESFDCTGYVDI